MGRIKIKRKIRNKNPKIGDCGTLSNYGTILFKIIGIEKNFLTLEEITKEKIKIKVLITKNRLINYDN